MQWQFERRADVASATAPVSPYGLGWSGQRFLACGVVYCQSSSDGVDRTFRQLPGTGDTRCVVVGNASLVLTSP